MVFKIICVGSIPAILDILFKRIKVKPSIKKLPNKNLKPFFKRSLFRTKKIVLSLLQKNRYKLFLTRVRPTQKVISSRKKKNWKTKLFKKKKKKLVKKKKKKFFRKIFSFKTLELKFSFKNNLFYKNYDFPQNALVNVTSKKIFIKPVHLGYNTNKFIFSYLINYCKPKIYPNPSIFIYSDPTVSSLPLWTNLNIFFSLQRLPIQLTKHSPNLDFFFLNKHSELVKYLPYWASLLRHKFFLRKIYKKKTLGSYPIPGRYLFINDIFFPSITNIQIFHKHIGSLKRSFTNQDRIISNNSLFLDKAHKRYLSSTFKFNLIFKKFWKFLGLLSKFKVLRKIQKLFFKYKNFKKRKKKRHQMRFKFLIIIRRRRWRKKIKKFFKRKKKFNWRLLNYKYFIKKKFLVKLKVVELSYKPSKVVWANNTSNFLSKRIKLMKSLSIFNNCTTGLTNLANNSKFNILFFNKMHLILLSIKFSIFLKNIFFNLSIHNIFYKNYFFKKLDPTFLKTTNLVPSSSFNARFSKTLVLVKSNSFFKENITPWVFNTLIRFMEFSSGKKCFLQVNPFMNQAINTEFVILYKRWLPRFFAFEKRLGHRFFLEEAFHIIHMSFNLHDIKMISTWLKAIIKRISFWKTRFIFRFIKYIFNNYLIFIFDKIGIKGFKVKLKGKISVAGNSRKRTILYRVGKTSHATCSLKVMHNFSTIVTFTGVMGFQVWIFY